MPDEHGLVVARFGAEVLIQTADGTTQRAVARRKLESIVCGDRVRWRREPSGDITVVAIEPRRNRLQRTYFRGKPRSIAANLDCIVVVFAAEPAPDWSLVDGLLLTARRMVVDVILVRNKCDLPLTPDSTEMIAVYRGIGYPVLETTSHEPSTVNALARALEHRTSVLVGQSGTGKSTLLNLLVPDAKARTAELSDTTGFGQHTTSMARLYALPLGGALIDSPGVRDFTPALPPPAEIQFGFVEFGPYAAQCRFNDCLHRSEPDCAVRAAVATGHISAARYASYLDFLASVEP